MRLTILVSTISLFCSLASADQNTATLTKLSTQSFVLTKIFTPGSDNEWMDQCLNHDKKHSDWSSWFVSGVNDLYQDEERPLNCFWACFNDHNFKDLYMADSKAIYSDARGTSQSNSVKNSENSDFNKTVVKIENQGLELMLDGMVVCNKNGFKPYPVKLKNKIRTNSTISDAVKILGPGYINSESGTGSIIWFFDDGSILSTEGWPSSIAEKVTLKENKNNTQENGNTQPARIKAKYQHLENGWGFNSLYYLFSKDRWKEAQKTEKKILNGSVTVGLETPKQTVLLYNAWSIPMVGSENDIRLADLKKNIFKHSLIFTQVWPTFTMPGYVVAVHKRDGGWALIAEMGDYFFIENDGSLGVSRRASK